jgi:inner membrane protein
VENVAHTLAGLLLAEVVASARARKAPDGGRFARLAYLVSGVANNLPDGDQLYTAVTGGKLGYLLHHRGHTHTLPVGFLLGLAVAAITIAIARRKAPLQRGDASWLCALGLAGAVVHITMDAWNVYGVHPFWPVYDGWLYGDALFIVEPLFWLIGIPVLYFAAERRWWKITLGILFALMLVLPWVAASLIPLGARLALLLVAGASALVASRLRPQRRAWLGVGGFAAVALVFLLASQRARAVVTHAAARPDQQVVDVALSSMPANPFCFTGQLLELGADGTLGYTRLTVAPFAGIVPVSSCPVGESGSTAPLQQTTKSDSDSVRYRDELRAPLAELRKLAQENCQARAALIFMRIPYWVEADGKLVLGDLRFDRSQGLDFADVELEREPQSCPRFLPSWTPPRADLIQ